MQAWQQLVVHVLSRGCYSVLNSIVQYNHVVITILALFPSMMFAIVLKKA
jgi:hypothetical protein